jgi:hypothetical protein
LELETVSVRPPTGFESVAVQLPPAPTAILVGVQFREDTVGTGHRATVVDWEETPSVAVTVACPGEVIVPAVAVKPADELPAGTVTVAGRESSPEPEPRDTFVAEETVCDRESEQEAAAPDMRAAGVQEMPVTRTGATRFTVVACEPEPSTAVTVELWLAGIETDAVALKVAEAAPGANVTDAGTASRGLLLESVTLAAALKAAVLLA